MVNDGDAIYHMILGSPEDDVPRLVYADWLEENEQPDRARFIRLQIELEKYLPEERPPAIIQEVDELLSAHRSQWIPTHEPQLRFHFRRGFLEQVHTSIPVFLREASRLFTNWPILTFVPSGNGYFDQLVGSPYWMRLRRFWGNAALQEYDILRWADPKLSHLVELSLHHCGFGASELQHLFHSKKSFALQRLHLSDNPITDMGCAVLADAECLTRLKHLDLSTTTRLSYAQRIHAAGATELAYSSHLTRLESLNFSGQIIGDGGLTSLAGSQIMRNLRVLHLDSNDIGAIGTSGIDALIDSIHLTELRVLNLRGNPIGNAGIRELAKWKGLLKLIDLNVQQCQITELGASSLLDSPYRHPNLRIRINGNHISQELITAIEPH